MEKREDDNKHRMRENLFILMKNYANLQNIYLYNLTQNINING